MAIYHASAKIISRSGGKSVVASAAYRAGDKLTDERLGKSFDYTKKQGVDSTVILAPKNAPDWVNNREKLWNEVEAVEKRKDSQLAREFNIALPVELDKEQMKNLALSYVREQFVDRGMIADVAFHDLETSNPHFHVLLTMRDITEQGFGLKNRDWNSKDLLVSQREAWATHVNAVLERVGLVFEKIDHRTLVAQGITDRLAQVHLGPELHRIREKSIEAEDLEGFRDKYQIGDLYESINEINRELAKSKIALKELDKLMVSEQEAMGTKSLDKLGQPSTTQMICGTDELSQQGCPNLSDFFLGEEIQQQTTSFPSAQNRTMNPTETNLERQRESTSEPINPIIFFILDFLRFHLTTEYEGQLSTLKSHTEGNLTTLSLKSASTGEKLFQATKDGGEWMVEHDNICDVELERFSLIRSSIEQQNQINRTLYLELKEDVIADLLEQNYEVTPELIDLNIAYRLFFDDGLSDSEIYRILIQSDQALELSLPDSILFCQNLHFYADEVSEQIELENSIELS